MLISGGGQTSLSSLSDVESRNKNNWKSGFTLAEVLITLGIIGVVAAMTLPALIQNYEKKVVVNRLKYAFNIISNDLQRAEADNGNITEWGLVSEARKEYNAVQNRQFRSKFVNMYMKPYLNGATLTEDKSLADLGYKNPIKAPTGTIVYPTSTAAPVLRLANGIVILLTASTGTLEDKKVVIGTSFAIDIDGPNGKNTLGKDVFQALIPFSINTRLIFNQAWTLKGSDNSFAYRDDNTRDDLINNCKTSGNWCGALIQRDGWQIKDDYPW